VEVDGGNVSKKQAPPHLLPQSHQPLIKWATGSLRVLSRPVDKLAAVDHVELVDGEIDGSPLLLLALERKRRHGDVVARRPEQAPPLLLPRHNSSEGKGKPPELRGP
jgi:hypothetical protein